MLTSLLQNYRDHKRLFTLAHEQLLNPIFNNYEAICQLKAVVAAIEMPDNDLHWMRGSLAKLLKLLLLTDHHHLDKFMLAISIDKAVKSKQSAIADISIDHYTSAGCEDELKVLSASFVFSNMAADGKKAYHLLLFDACLRYLQTISSTRGIEGVVAIFDLLMSESRLDVGSSPDEEATKRHVSRCVTLVATMLQCTFYHSNSVETSKQSTRDEVHTALQARLLETLHRYVDRIPQHVTMLKFTNYLFYLLKHSLLLAHKYAKAQPSSLVIVHALDCIRAVSNIEYKTLMQDHTLVAVVRILDITSDSEAALAIKRTVLQDIWATYSNIRNIDTLIKALVEVSEADSVYLQGVGQQGGVQNILGQPAISPKVRTTFSSLPMGSYRIVYKVLFSDVNSSIKRSRDVRYMLVGTMLSCHRQVLATSLIEFDKLHLYILYALKAIVADLYTATNKLLLIAVLKEILQYMVKFFSYNMQLLFKQLDTDGDTVNDLLVCSLIDILRGETTGCVEVLELLVYLVMYVLNAYTKTNRDKDLQYNSCVVSCMQLVEQQVSNLSKHADMGSLEQVVRLLVGHIEVFKYIYKWGSEQLQQGVKDLVTHVMQRFVQAYDEANKSASELLELLQSSVCVDSQVLHEVFAHSVRQIISEVPPQNSDLDSAMYSNLMRIFPVEMLGNVARDISVFPYVIQHLDSILLSSTVSLEPILRFLCILVSGLASSASQCRLGVPLLCEFVELGRLLGLAPVSRTLGSRTLCLLGDVM
ncbi:hypothetical protein EON64_01155, partial [archaeon]